MPSGTIGDTSTGSNNVTGAVADYASIAAWEAAIDGNDQTGTCIQNAELSGGAAVTLDAAYTNLVLTAHADCALNAPTYAALVARAHTTKTITVTATSATIEKIGFNTGTAQCVKFDATDGSWTLRRCVFRGSYDGMVQVTGAGSPVLTVSNCALMGTGSGVSFYSTVRSTMKLYHCSGSNPASHWSMYYPEGSMECYACIAQGGSTNVGQFRSAGMSGDYNVSQDATAPGSASTKYARSEPALWFVNTTSGSEDLRLRGWARGRWAGYLAKDAIDHSGWPSDVATDIAGTTRSAPIDPGAWQGVSTGPQVDSEQHTSGASNTLSVTVTERVSGAKRKLVVLVCLETASATVTGITYNGVALTKIDHSENPTGTHNRTEMWYLDDPDTGTHNVVVTWSSGTGMTAAVSLYYAAAGTPTVIAKDNHNGGSRTASSCSVVTTTDDNYILTSADQSTSTSGATPTGENYEDSDQNISGSRGFTGHVWADFAGTHNLGWQYVDSGRFGQLAVAFPADYTISGGSGFAHTFFVVIH